MSGTCWEQGCLWLAQPGPVSFRLGLDIKNLGVFNIWAGFRLSDRAQIPARPRIRSACNLVATLFKQLLESPNNLQKAQLGPVRLTKWVGLGLTSTARLGLGPDMVLYFYSCLVWGLDIPHPGPGKEHSQLRVRYQYNTVILTSNYLFVNGSIFYLVFLGSYP